MEKIRLSIPDTSNIPNPLNGIERVNQPITNINGFKEYVEQYTKHQKPTSKKYYCLMLFYEEGDITGQYNTHNKWINTNNIYFHNGTLALNAFANTPCPASQLIDANTIEELAAARNQMLLNFKDKTFIQQLHETL